jgi:hypothetical protein
VVVHALLSGSVHALLPGESMWCERRGRVPRPEQHATALPPKQGFILLRLQLWMASAVAPCALLQ